MVVKWNGAISSARPLNGGGPQGATLGPLEYLAQTNHNTDFLNLKEKFIFIDDLSILEIINLIMMGISSYNFKSHVASDIGEHGQYISPENLKLQSYLDNMDLSMQSTGCLAEEAYNKMHIMRSMEKEAYDKMV